MGKYFGTDGFRGEANENLTADTHTKSADSWAGTTENRNAETGMIHRHGS